ncbi:MAG TPA: hypothetical protein VGN57_20340 [Pirellulaceae bacterium]|nr:hypothetical protein [Pirellulaceae bacterium]
MTKRLRSGERGEKVERRSGIAGQTAPRMARRDYRIGGGGSAAVRCMGAAGPR